MSMSISLNPLLRMVLVLVFVMWFLVGTVVMSVMKIRIILAGIQATPMLW